MKKVKQLKTNRQKKEYLNDDEFKKLVGHLDKSYFSEHRDYAMIVLMLDTGMRLGECSSLLVSDIQACEASDCPESGDDEGEEGQNSVFLTAHREHPAALASIQRKIR